MKKIGDMSKTSIISLAVIILLYGGAVGYAVMERESKNSIEAKEFQLRELYISQTNVPLAQIINKLPNSSAWNIFMREHSQGYVYIDPRSGRPSSLTQVFPLIPGTGNDNRITLESLSARLGYKVENITEETVKQIALKFLDEHAALLAIDLREISEVRAANPAESLWQVFIRRQKNGIPVRDAYIIFTINHGNLVLWGMEKWGNISINPVPSITKKQALTTAFAFLPSSCLPIFPSSRPPVLPSPHLEYIPTAPPNWNGNTGTGYDYRLVWAFMFKLDGYHNTWEMLVDAHSGEIISFQDLNQYALKKIVGSLYPVSSDECGLDGRAVSGVPMPFAYTGFAPPNDYTSLDGLYDYSTGAVCTQLNGRYIRISNNCGIISECADTGGDLDLEGTNGEHDCTVPSGSHSTGDTAAARTAFAELTMINRSARGWVNYNWLDTQQTAVTNINATCGGYTTPLEGQLIFYRSGGGCRNSGEVAGMLDHEWGHALDANDTNGTSSNPACAFADVIAAMRLHTSCVGRGYFWTLDRGCGQWICPSNPSSTGYNCSGYGDCCYNCTGVRDIDYMKHQSGSPHTVLGFICNGCSGSGTAPCGHEQHCESIPVSEAAWDLAAYDLQSAPFNYDKQFAFELTTRFAFVGSGSVTNWFACNCALGTSDGCGATSGYMQWLATDDDDGNVNNGTPHMTALYSAFSRHEIACLTPTPVNSGCAGGPVTAPTLTIIATDNGAVLSWNAVPGASQYYVFKTSGIMGCDFGKIRIATVTGTTYTDQALNCYSAYYMVIPVGSSSSCLGPASNCASVVPPYPAPSNITATGTAPNEVTVSWSPVTGATGYNVYRRYTICGNQTEQKVANNIATTSYVDTTVAGGVTYYYRVASNSAQCEAQISDWVSVIPTGNCTFSPCFNGATAVVNTICGLKVQWDAGTSSCGGFPDLKYNIYRSTDPAFVPSPTNLRAFCRTGTTWSDGNAADGTTYYYVVRAEDSSAGGSGPCNGGNTDSNTTKRTNSVMGPLTQLFLDGFESGMSAWTISANWTQSSTYSHYGLYSAWSNNLDNRPCDTMTKTSFVNIPASGSFPKLHFWTRHSIESGFDAGILLASTNGATWSKLSLSPPYPGTTSSSAQPCLGTNPQSAFSGTNTEWTEYIADLTSYKSYNMIPRFSYATDASNHIGGWYIDDVLIDHYSACTQSIPGRVLNTLTISKSPGNLVLNWAVPPLPCITADYAIYRGTLPIMAYSYAPITCTTNNTTSFSTAQGTGSYYYLVVPQSNGREGSYGLNSSGSERPQGFPSCSPQQIGICIGLGSRL